MKDILTLGTDWFEKGQEYEFVNFVKPLVDSWEGEVVRGNIFKAVETGFHPHMHNKEITGWAYEEALANPSSMSIYFKPGATFKKVTS